MRRILPLLLPLLLQAPPVLALDPATPAAQYARAAWTEAHGLPSSLIWAMTQDHDGYLWLGTDAGLVRFDGVRFVHWNALNRPPLPAEMVMGLLTARDGALWIGGGTGGRLSRWKDGVLTGFQAQDGLPDSVTVIFQDHDDNIWAAGRGLSRLRGDRWERVGREALADLTVGSLYEDREHTLWVATSGDTFALRAGTERLERVPTPFIVRAVVEDDAGALWAASPELAIGRLSSAALDRELERWRDVNGWRVLRDKQGNLWVATLGQGVLRVTPDLETHRATVQRLAAEQGLTSDVVRSLFEDREGNIWIGTQNGLNRLTDNTITAVSSSAEISQPVRALTVAADGSVWVGTDNGIQSFAPGERRRYGRREGLPSLVIGALHTDRQGAIWIAMDQGGLARFFNRTFERVPLPAARLQRVWAMTSDHEDALWLCEVNRGLHRWKDGALTSFEDVPEVGQRFCVSALSDRQGRVWIGFSDGSLAVREGGTFRAFAAEQGLPGGRVSVIAEARDGTIWVGSSRGLSRYSHGRFVTVTASQGLPDSNVRSIVEDESGQLWIGVSSGILRVDPREFETAVATPGHRLAFTLFDMFDGLPGVPMSVGGYPTAGRAGTGALWFVTSNGLAVLNPARISKPRFPPQVRIEGVVADHQPLVPLPAAALPPRTSSLQIDYTAPSFAAPAKVRFLYRLDGFDADWVDAGTRRQAFYTNLPPRSYTFRVKANNDGVWNETGASWSFTIRPAFYQTTWFAALGVALMSLAVYAGWQARARRVRRQFALVLAERTRVAREIHDTLLQSLVGVAFQFDTLETELEPSATSARARVLRLRGQVETYIREARQSIWDLRSPTLKSHGLDTALRDLGEKIAGKTVGFDLTVSGTPRTCDRRVQEALLRIGQEAISNAVRHAHASHVHADLEYTDSAVHLRVTDDGQGFDTAAAGKRAGEQHWGLTSMRERTQQVGAEFSLQSDPGRGTRVEVTAPLAARTKAFA